MFCPSICTVRILSSTRHVPVATGVRALAVTIQRSAEPFAPNIKFSSLGSPNGTVVLRQCPTKAAEFESCACAGNCATAASAVTAHQRYLALEFMAQPRLPIRIN